MCSICLKSKRKTDITVLGKGFIEDLWDASVSLALIGLLCILGIQYILGNWWFSIGILPIPSLVFRSIVFLLVISTADKLLILIYSSKDELVYNPKCLETRYI